MQWLGFRRLSTIVKAIFEDYHSYQYPNIFSNIIKKMSVSLDDLANPNDVQSYQRILKSIMSFHIAAYSGLYIAILLQKRKNVAKLHSPPLPTLPPDIRFVHKVKRHHLCHRVLWLVYGQICDDINT